MQNNNFAETLASVASEFGVEDTAKHDRGIKPSKRPYFRWTDEQLEQLATLRDEGKSANEIAEALGVSRDKVITKLAAMAARQRTGSKTPEPSTEPVPEAEAEPEQEAETEPSVEAEPEPVKEPVDVDRMIFTAFDAVVGRVDDFNKMAACWRKALSVIEQEIRKLSYIIEQHPDAEDAVCHIAAIIAYDKTNA
ncbi:MAG: GcrA family cell cycle regulator [Butyricicoccus sp.]